jgi:cytochrome c553
MSVNSTCRTVVTFLLGSGFCAAAVAQQATNNEVAELKEEIATLKGMLPSQSHTMMDVEFHFANLWFAGKAANWPLATFYFNETRQHLNWAVRVVPIRRLAGGGQLDLRPMLKGIEESGLAPIKAAIDKSDGAAFEAAYQRMLTQCIACHTAAEKPYLRPQIPKVPPSALIDMAPH